MINVKAFGAVGNGTTDDTVAIQNAINSLWATGGTVYFPAGSYLIGETPNLSLTIAVPSICLRGERVSGATGSGVIIKLSSNNTDAVDAIDVAALNLKIQDIQIESLSDAISGSLMNFYPGSDNCVIEDCRFIGGYNPINIESCNNIYIGRCAFNDIFIPASVSDGSNFYIYMIGSASSPSTGLTIRDCNFAAGSYTPGYITTAIQINEYCSSVLLNNTTVDNGGNGLVVTVSTNGRTYGADPPSDIDMVEFGTDQIEGQSINLVTGTNIRMLDCTVGAGGYFYQPPEGMPTIYPYPSITIGSGVVGFVAMNSEFRGAFYEGVSIHGRDISLLNCRSGNNGTHETGQAQLLIGPEADDVAIIGGMFSAFRDGDNSAVDAIQIDAGAQRVRILGADLSRNVASTSSPGSIFFSPEAASFDAASNLAAVSANNLQLPTTHSQRIAADCYNNLSVASPSAMAYTVAVIAGQRLWVTGIGYVLGSGTAVISFAAAGLSGLTLDSTAHYMSISPVLLIDGTSAPVTVQITLTDCGTGSNTPVDLTVTLACQSIS